MKEELNWNELGFKYRKTNALYLSYWKDGEWDEGNLVEDDEITINISSPSLHYGQQGFEGMKAYRAKDGRILLFRPEMNARRLQRTARRLLMPEFPEEQYIEAVKKVVKANEEYIPPYGTGGSLYIRPMQIGIGENLGVAPAKEYLFAVFVSPVGAYFKGGMTPIDVVTTKYDRAAAYGTGQAKCGGNYSASLWPHKEAADAGYADCVYLDPLTHTKIDEAGAANFFAITHDDRFVTPQSSSILESITKLSLLQAAEDLGMETAEEDVYIDKLDLYKEAGACGTAAVISPIGSLTHEGKKHVFYSETEVGPKTKALYEYLVGIQYGDLEDPHGWVVEVD